MNQITIKAFASVLAENAISSKYKNEAMNERITEQNRTYVRTRTRTLTIHDMKAHLIKIYMNSVAIAINVLFFPSGRLLLSKRNI